MSDRIRSVGNYVLGARLGHGATSEVFAAEHRFLGDRAAIKLLRVDLAADGASEEAVAEIVAEAAKLRAVQHPNVVRVLDAGVDPASGRCYLAMERVDGESLAARLERAGRLGEAEVRRLGAAIADGLAAVHAAGLVHRDLKPANVMLDGDAPKLVDFGIAKVLGGDAAAATSRRVGTPAYMAPEQLAGGMIAPCVDVWALGVLLFEAVTGRLPFQGFEGGRCPQLVETAPRAGALAPVSPPLERLIARCLERDPGRRPPSMEAIARALRGEGGDAAEPGGERITEDAGPLVAPAAAPSAARAPEQVPVKVPASVPAPAQAPRQAPAQGQVRAPRPAPRWLRWLIIGGAGVIAAAVGIAAALVVIDSRDGAGTSSSAPAAPTAEVTSAPSAEPAPPPAEMARAPEPAPPATENAPTPAPESSPSPSPASPASRPSPPPAPAQSRPRPPPRTTLAVQVRSSPAGAQIFLDGKLLGTTPRRLELAAPATLTLRYQGYQPARVRAGKPGPIDVRLTRACAQPPCEDLN